MNKKRIFTVAGIFFLVLIAAAAFVPYSVSYKININAGIYRIGEQLTDKNNLIKWVLPFADEKKEGVQINENENTITGQSANARVTVIDMFSVGLTLTQNNSSNYFLYSVAANDSNLKHNAVAVSFKTTLIGKLPGLNNVEKLAKASIANLKAHMEDPLSLYGYDIKMITVTDTTFLVSKTTCKKEELTAAAEKLFTKLINFSEINSGGFTGLRIFFKQPLPGDTAYYEISGGIAVTKEFTVEAGPGIEFKRMPLGKNLIAAIYIGPYGEINKLYKAMEKFKLDNSLSSMAIPFEKLPEGKLNLNASEMVRLEVCYPIF